MTGRTEPNLHSGYSTWPTLFPSLFLFHCISCSLSHSLWSPFYVAQGTNKSSEGLPPDTVPPLIPIFPAHCALRAEQHILLVHISLSQPWLANHALCLSSPLQQSYNLHLNEGYIKLGATAENLIRVSPTRDAIVRLCVIERTIVVLQKSFQHEVVVSGLWSAFNKIVPQFQLAMGSATREGDQWSQGHFVLIICLFRSVWGFT